MVADGAKLPDDAIEVPKVARTSLRSRAVYAPSAQTAHPANGRQAFCKVAPVASFAWRLASTELLSGRHPAMGALHATCRHERCIASEWCVACVSDVRHAVHELHVWLLYEPIRPTTDSPAIVSSSARGANADPSGHVSTQELR